MRVTITWPGSTNIDLDPAKVAQRLPADIRDLILHGDGLGGQGTRTREAIIAAARVELEAWIEANESAPALCFEFEHDAELFVEAVDRVVEDSFAEDVDRLDDMPRPQGDR